MSSNSPGQVQLWLVRVLLVQFLKWWKWAMNVRSYVFLKMLLFLKILSLVLNLLSQNAKLLRSGDEGALLQLWRRSKKPHFQSCYGKILWQRVVSVEWCPGLICQASMIKRCWYIFCSIFCAIEFNTCSSPYNQTLIY